jgi:2-methylcitrate synthase
LSTIDKGLRGIIGGETAISSVSGTNTSEHADGLYYRGYNVKDLSEHASFEEVVLLLIDGKLPNRETLQDFKESLLASEALIEKECGKFLTTLALSRPKGASPMLLLSAITSTLGSAFSEVKEPLKVASLLLVALPKYLLINYLHRNLENFYENNLAFSVLNSLPASTPRSSKQIKVLDASMTLYAEHEFNASTFVMRVISSTLSDPFSATAGAIGALKGPLHGGANELAHALITSFSSPSEAENSVVKMLERKEKIMGFGHAVYVSEDPRSVIIKGHAAKLEEDFGKGWFPIAEKIEEVVRKKKGLFPNADFYHAVAYEYLSIPRILYTPIFVIGRLPGWLAHYYEQQVDNRLIRPSAKYIGPSPKDFLPLDER